MPEITHCSQILKTGTQELQRSSCWEEKGYFHGAGAVLGGVCKAAMGDQNHLCLRVPQCPGPLSPPPPTSGFLCLESDLCSQQP